MVAPSSSKRTSSPPAPSTTTSRWVSASSATRSAVAVSETGGRPDARAAAAGESAPGKRANSNVVVTPDSRMTSSRSPGSPGATPVCAGLTTATGTARRSASAATAAVTTVLPTPVSVPVTTRTLTGTTLGPAPRRPHRPHRLRVGGLRSRVTNLYRSPR